MLILYSFLIYFWVLSKIHIDSRLDVGLPHPYCNVFCPLVMYTVLPIDENFTDLWCVLLCLRSRCFHCQDEIIIVNMSVKCEKRKSRKNAPKCFFNKELCSKCPWGNNNSDFYCPLLLSSWLFSGPL